MLLIFFASSPVNCVLREPHSRVREKKVLVAGEHAILLTSPCAMAQENLAVLAAEQNGCGQEWQSL